MLGYGPSVEHHGDRVRGECCQNGEPCSAYTVLYGEKAPLWLVFTLRARSAHGAYGDLCEMPCRGGGWWSPAAARARSRSPPLPAAARSAGHDRCGSPRGRAYHQHARNRAAAVALAAHDLDAAERAERAGAGTQPAAAVPRYGRRAQHPSWPAGMGPPCGQVSRDEPMPCASGAVAWPDDGAVDRLPKVGSAAAIGQGFQHRVRQAGGGPAEGLAEHRVPAKWPHSAGE